MFGKKFLLALLLICLFCLTGNSIVLCSEKNDKPNAYELKNKARKMKKQNNVYKAIEYLEQYVKLKPDDLKSQFNLAKLYYITRDYSNASDYLDTVIRKRTKKFEKAYYYHGVVSMNLEKYDAAIESLTKFRREYRGNRDPEDLRGIAYDLISSAEWAKEHKDSVADVTLNHLGYEINGPHIEFAPFPISENELVYSALVPDTSDEDKEIRQIYIAEQINNTWKSKGKFAGPINHPLQHTGNAAFSLDGNRMYFTRCKLNWQNKEICELYMSEKKNDEWQEAVKLPYPVNNETNTSTQPAIGYNSRRETDVIYFVSDREGSRGGMDIWYTEYNSRTKEYREPRNLGRGINSDADECCPFFDKNTGSLFFSSKGRNGYGGYDIYRSTGSGRRWSDGEALPKPINSSYDDTYYSTLTGTDGFFTSNRPGSMEMINGSCCDDIFYFKYNQCVTLPTSGNVFNITNRDIYDLLNNKYNQKLEYIEDNEALAGIPVKLFVVDTNTHEEILINHTLTDENGNYNFILERNKKYVVVVENYGYFDKRISITAKEFNCDETIDLEETGINYLPEITVIFNIYYEHDKARLTKEARDIIDTTLLPLFDLYPTAKVEIGSHTDFTGSDNYNIKLSQRRSESVVKYLILKGIDEERLVAKGYGEHQPIAPNMNPDGTDNPIGRQLNRRTEFKIIGSVNSFYNDTDD